MGRAPCCDKANVKRGPWSPEEDAALRGYIQKHGTGGNWITLPHKAGLKRCGKSCRLRWLNYLRPDIKHGGFTDEEDNIICTIYSKLGSRWSIIASYLPGRTDNDVKNYWNTKLKKKLIAKQTTSVLTTITSGIADQTHYSPSQTRAPPPAVLLAAMKTEGHSSGEPLITSTPADLINSVPTPQQDYSKLYSQLQPCPFTMSGAMHQPISGCCIDGNLDNKVSATSSPIAADNCTATVLSSDDMFLMELGSDDIFGYGDQETLGDQQVSPFICYSGLESMKAAPASLTKPQVLQFQSFTYYS